MIQPYSSSNILFYSFPTFITLLCDSLTIYSDYCFIAKYGILITDSYGIASVWANIFGMAFFIGFTSGIYTLASQAYGNGEKDAIGFYFNRARVLLLIISVLVSILAFPARHILIFLGIDALVAAETQQFLYQWIPLYFILAQYYITNTFLECQQVFYQQMFINFICCILHPLWTILLTNLYGHHGILMASYITYGSALLFTYIYIYTYKDKVSTVPFTLKGIFSNIGTMCYLSFSGICMSISENGLSGFMSIIAANISNEELAANVSLNSIMLIFYNMNAAFGSPLKVFAGNLIGKGDTYMAKKVAMKCFKLNLIFSLALSLLFIYTKGGVSGFYTSDAKTRDYIESTVYLLVVVIVINCAMTACKQVLVALGKQKYGLFKEIIAYYLISVPICYFSSIVLELGIYGLWVGQGIGDAVLVVIYMNYLSKLNWDRVSSRVKAILCIEKVVECTIKSRLHMHIDVD